MTGTLASSINAAKAATPVPSTVGLSTSFSFSLRPLANARPRHISNYRLSRKQELFLSDLGRKLLSDGVIEHCRSPWNSPVNLVPKGDKFRLTVDLRHVNSSTENDVHPIPLIFPLLQQLARFHFFAAIDLVNGYWHVPASDDNTRQMLAFTIPGLGQVRWTRLAQGLKQAPSLFQAYMENIMAPFREYCLPYLDNINIGANSQTELDDRVADVVAVLLREGLVINKDKTILNATSLPILGYRLAHDSIMPDDDYVAALASTPVPSEKRSLRRFLGKLSHLVRFFPHFQDARASLFSALNSTKTGSSIALKGRTLEAFQYLTSALRTAKPIQRFNAASEEPVSIVGDAGQTGYAALVFQGPRLVSTLSRKWPSKTIASASSTVREATCLREAVLAFTDITMGRPFRYITDSDNLKKLHEKLSDPAVDPGLSPYLQRLRHTLDHVWHHLIVEWRPRTDPIISAADAWGRPLSISSARSLRTDHRSLVYKPP